MRKIFFARLVGCLSLIISCLIFCHPAISYSESQPAANTQANESAEKVVEELHKHLIESMKMGDKASCAERYKFLAPLVLKSFDFETICRIVLGRRHWRNLDDETRASFIRAFSEMTVATYAMRFASYSGERFETKDARMDSRGHCIVESYLVKKDGDKIDFKYICRKTNEGWKIVSVSARGVNDLSIKRADYQSFLKGHSVQELIKKLQEQVGDCIKNSQK